jgi:hypothetical protein
VAAVRLARMQRPDEAVATLEAGHRLHRAAGLPPLEAERYTAVVYESIDLDKARAAWQRYVVELGRISRPSAREVSQLAAAMAALDELAKRAPPTR